MTEEDEEFARIQREAALKEALGSRMRDADIHMFGPTEEGQTHSADLTEAYLAGLRDGQRTQPNIYVLDQAVPVTVHEHIHAYVINSRFRIGWKDQADIANSSHQYLHSAFTLEELAQTGFVQSITDKRMLELIAGRTPVASVVNLSVPADVNFMHTHRGQDVLLYYVNLSWRPEWAGETVFFNQNKADILFSSAYTPNRAVFFDGEIPHSIRCQSIAAPHYRFTLSILFNRE